MCIRDRLGWGCWKALVLEQDRPLFEERVTGLAPGDSSVCELRIRDKQDRVRWLAVYNEAEHDAKDPAVHRLHGACQDITERKRAEEELRFTKIIVEQAGDLVFWMTADGVLKYANRMARETLGYSLDELLSLIHISEPTRLGMISYAVFCLKKKKKHKSKMEPSVDDESNNRIDEKTQEQI